MRKGTDQNDFVVSSSERKQGQDIMSHTAALVADLTIAIFALSIGVFHVMKLGKVERALPTHELKHFPYYVKEVAELIARAQEEILIASDFPCYCIFSSPELWNDYKHEIEKAVQKSVKGDKPSI